MPARANAGTAPLWQIASAGEALLSRFALRRSSLLDRLARRILDPPRFDRRTGDDAIARRAGGRVDPPDRTGMVLDGGPRHSHPRRPELYRSHVEAREGSTPGARRIRRRNCVVRHGVACTAWGAGGRGLALSGCVRDVPGGGV